MVGFVCCNVMARPHDAVAPLPHDHISRVQASKLSNCQVVCLCRCTSGCIKAAPHQAIVNNHKTKQSQDTVGTRVTGCFYIVISALAS